MISLSGREVHPCFPIPGPLCSEFRPKQILTPSRTVWTWAQRNLSATIIWSNPNRTRIFPGSSGNRNSEWWCKTIYGEMKEGSWCVEKRKHMQTPLLTSSCISLLYAIIPKEVILNYLMPFLYFNKARKRDKLWLKTQTSNDSRWILELNSQASLLHLLKLRFWIVDFKGLPIHSTASDQYKYRRLFFLERFITLYKKSPLSSFFRASYDNEMFAYFI